MKRATTLFILACAPWIAHGQCDLSVQVTSYNAYCGGFEVAYQILNGTPPYGIHAFNLNGDLISETTSSTSDVRTFGGTSWDFHLEVTDADDCFAEDMALPSPEPHTHPTHVFQWSTECTTGITTLRMDVSEAICDASGLQYQMWKLVGTGYVPYGGGSFANDWVEEQPWLWRRVQGIPAGRYMARLAPGSAACSGTTQCWNTWPPEVPLSEFLAINTGDCGGNKVVRAALSGPFDQGPLMRDDLRANGLLPTVEPYSALGYVYSGGGANTSISSSWLSLTGSQAVVDWVVLEVRSNVSPYPVLRSKPAILLRNGEVWDTDRDPYVNFGILPTGLKRIALRHRNHLGVMTSSAASLTQQPDAPAVDLRSGSAYGTNARKQVGSTWCLWSGDATGDGTLKYTGSGNDRDPILTAVGSTSPNNPVSNVYDRRDTNLDGVIKYTGTGNDRDIILTNVGSTTPNNARTQQLP